MAEPVKKSDKKIFVIALGLFVALAILSYALSSKPEVISDLEESAVEMAEDGMDSQSAAETGFDLEMAVYERVLGDPQAPIKISEHSSLTCGHCGNFHKDVFAAFKAAYIDTGRAYLVFSDFPLNAPALHASKIARCVPEERYFDFVEMLFSTQDKWAYDAGYLGYLKTKAAEFGADEALFNACLKNKELEERLISRIKAVQQQWQVSSTPSFVINNQEVIVGSKSFEEFDKAIQGALAKIKAAADSEAAAPLVPMLDHAPSSEEAPAPQLPESP